MRRAPDADIVESAKGFPNSLRNRPYMRISGWNFNSQNHAKGQLHLQGGSKSRTVNGNAPAWGGTGPRSAPLAVLFGMQFQGRRIHAKPLACRLRAVVELMAEMGVAT